jgi:hypothetical protein
MKRLFGFHSNAVWPRLYLSALFVFAYWFVTASLWLVSLPAPGADYEDGGGRDVRMIQAFILLGGSFVYGVSRLVRFHPACNSAYAGWLRISPWTAEKPLPLGPVHLVWQDMAVVAVLSAIAAWHAWVPAIFPVLTFGIGYFGGLTLLLAVTGRWNHFILLAFLWPALLLPAFEGIPTILLISAIIVVCFSGLQKSLSVFPTGFPTGLSGVRGSSVLQMDIRIELPGVQTAQTVGWPLAALSPKVCLASVSTKQSLAIAGALGWWSFCLMERGGAEPLSEPLLALTILLGLLRVGIYCGRMCPPINLWGRLVSWRLFLPGYDKVFATPLAALALAIVGGMLIRNSGSGYIFVQAALFGLILFVLFAGGPTLISWTLTGHHRFRAPPGRSKLAVRKI